MSDKGLVTKEPQTGGYLMSVASGEWSLAQLIQDNIGDAGINKFMLNRIRIPLGGVKNWTIEELEGPQSVEALTGVVVHWTPARVYYPGEFGGGNQPPQCSSNDGVKGRGIPGGYCADCKLNEWGSKGDGKRGKACKEGRALFIIRGQNQLPDLLMLPPTSIKPWSEFALKLTSSGLPYHAAELKITLETARSNDQIVYSVIKPTTSRRLDADELNRFALYRDQIVAALKAETGPIADIDDFEDAA